MKTAASKIVEMPAVEEPTKHDSSVAGHHSRNLTDLHKMVETISALEDDYEGFLHPNLIETLTEARQKVEEVRDSILLA